MLPNYWKFQNRSVQTFGFVYHDTNGQNHGPIWKTQMFLLSGICMVILWQKFCGKSHLRKSYWSMAGRKFQIGNVSSYTVKTYVLICVCGWHQVGWKETKHWADLETTQQKSWFGKTNIFPWPRILGVNSKTMRNKQWYCGQLQSHVWTTNFCGGNWKTSILCKFSYSFMVLWYGLSCKELCGAIVWVSQQVDSTTLQSIYSMHRWPSLWRECFYLARIGRPDFLWSVNKLARSITKWTKACDKRLNRLILHIHHTCEYKQYCHVGNTAKQCRLGRIPDSDLARDLEDSKSTSGRTLCILGSHTFVPTSWMCKKQTAVSHSSTGSEIISLDTGLRLDGLPALELWDLIVSVLGNVSCVSNRSGQPESDVKKHQKYEGKINVMKNMDSVPSNVQFLRQEALLYVFEDNEAVIKMIIEGRSPTMRHVSRTHRVALDWLFDRINLDSKIKIKYIDTKNHLTDIWTKREFHTWWLESFVEFV